MPKGCKGKFTKSKQPTPTSSNASSRASSPVPGPSYEDINMALHNLQPSNSSSLATSPVPSNDDIDMPHSFDVLPPFQDSEEFDIEDADACKINTESSASKKGRKRTSNEELEALIDNADLPVLPDMPFVLPSRKRTMKDNFFPCVYHHHHFHCHCHHYY